MFPEPSPAGIRKGRISGSSSKNSSELISIPFMSLDLTPGAGNLLDEFYWEILSPWRGESLILNTGPAPRSGAAGSTLWSILEAQPHPRYFLTRKACLGIIRRASERGKPLPPQLQRALEIQAGIRAVDEIEGGDDTDVQDQEIMGFDGYNGDLTGDVSATLGTNCGMSTGRNGVIQPLPVGIDSKHACATGDVANTLSTNCGSSTGRNGVLLPLAFSQNQRDEVRDLHDVAGALAAQPGMKQQTFVAAGVVTKGNGECFVTEDVHASLTGGGGQAGQGYPCVLCLNDQGGQFMGCSENITGTLRAQMHSHQPLVLESNQVHAVVREDGISPTLPASMGMGGGYVPMVYENHGIDSRYTGPYEVVPTISARCGTGGNNVPLVGTEPAVFSRQRTDVFTENDVVSTESARQHKDATDLIVQPYQETVGTLARSDHKGISNQYVNDDKCIVGGINLIRRLTPLECERLQGFPDGWTNIPSASDSARYKALGNSVAIPCVEFVMQGIALVLYYERRRRRWTIIVITSIAITKCEVYVWHM